MRRTAVGLDLLVRAARALGVQNHSHYGMEIMRPDFNALNAHQLMS